MMMISGSKAHKKLRPYGKHTT